MVLKVLSLIRDTGCVYSGQVWWWCLPSRRWLGRDQAL